MKTRGQVLLTGLLFPLILSYISTVINWERILGAFAAGLILAETEKQILEQQIISIADFFVSRLCVCVCAKTDQRSQHKGLNRMCPSFYKSASPGETPGVYDRRGGVICDLSVLNSTVPSNREGLIIATFLTLVAILGKVITEFTVFGNPELNKLAFGVAMIPRGEVGLVFKVKGSIAELVDKVQE